MAGLFSPKSSETVFHFCMIPVVHPGHGIFHPIYQVAVIVSPDQLLGEVSTGHAFLYTPGGEG